MANYCNNPGCEAYRKPQEGRHCAYCGEPLVSNEPAGYSSKKEVSADGISVTRVMNDSHDTISNNNTTIVLNGKSLEDLTLKDRKAAYRKYCSEKIVNGIITPGLRRNLDEYALELELSAEDRKEIERLVKKNSAASGYELTSLDRDNLDIIKESVSNNRIRINDMLPKLEAMSSSDNDEVQYYYNLLLVCSSPASIIRKYSDREQDIYWLTFWVNIAYLKNGQKVKAEQALRELSAWDTESQDNLYLLQSAGALLADDTDTAALFFSRGKNYSYLLNSLAKTVSYILNSKGIRRLSNSPEVNFYLEKLFGVKEEDIHVTPVESYRAPLPEPLRGKINATQNRTSAPTPASATSHNSNPAPAHVPAPTPAPVSQRPVTSPAKASGSKALSFIAIAAVIVAVVLFLPKKKKAETEQQQVSTQVAVTEKPAATTAKTASAGTAKPSQSKASTTVKNTSSAAKQASSSPSQSNSQNTAGTSSQTQTQPAAVQSQASPVVQSQPAVDPIAALKASADAGDKDAQFNLGMKYYEGNGVTKNYATAFQYLKPLADAGYVKAYFPVAEMYHGGRGVAKDRDAAEKWYQKAADAGNSKAKSILLNSF